MIKIRNKKNKKKLPEKQAAFYNWSKNY